MIPVLNDNFEHVTVKTAEVAPTESCNSRNAGVTLTSLPLSMVLVPSRCSQGSKKVCNYRYVRPGGHAGQFIINRVKIMSRIPNPQSKKKAKFKFFLRAAAKRIYSNKARLWLPDNWTAPFSSIFSRVIKIRSAYTPVQLRGQVHVMRMMRPRFDTTPPSPHRRLAVSWPNRQETLSGFMRR